MLDLTTRYKVVTLLGYTPGTIISGNINYSKTIDDKLKALPTELEATVTGLITRIESLDTRLGTALGRAGVKKVDDIEFSGEEMSSLRSEKKRVLRELGSYFDLCLGPYAASASLNVGLA